MQKRNKHLTTTWDESVYFGQEIESAAKNTFIYSRNKPFMFDRFLCDIILLSDIEYRILKDKNKWNTHSPVHKKLREDGLLFQKRQLEISDEARAFEIWVQVVNHCNLRCMGCATGMDVAQDMKKSLPQESIRPFFQKIFHDAQDKGFRKVKVKMGGGEPTLSGVSWIAELSRTSRELSEKYGMELEIDLLTNGLVSYDLLLEVLAKNKIGVSVSLDPERLVPGTTRPVTELVKKNLEKLVSKGVPCSGQFTIYKNNLEHLIPLYRFTCELGINMVWGLFRHQNKAQMELNRFDDLAPALEALYVDHYNRMKQGLFYGQIHSFDYLDIRGYKDAVCGAGDTYVVLDWNGDIYTCHETIRRGTPLARCSDGDNIFDSIQKNFGVSNRLNKHIEGDGIFDNQGGKGCHWVRETETGDFQKASKNTQDLNDFVGKMLVTLSIEKARIEGIILYAVQNACA